MNKDSFSNFKNVFFIISWKVFLLLFSEKVLDIKIPINLFDQSVKIGNSSF